MLYKDLKLSYLKDILNLNFAHFSYINGMCSCCFSPSDFPYSYWRDGIVITQNTGEWDNVNYVLFKNSINSTGEVNDNDKLSDFESIEYKFNDKNLLIKFCNELLKICNKFNYQVLLPPENGFSIILVNSECLIDKLNKKRYDRYINIGYKLLN